MIVDSGCALVNYAKSFAYKYSGVIKAINDILHGKGVSLETSKPPSLVALGCIKEKGALA